LVFTLNGLLVHRNAEGVDICLADFNGYTPDTQPAPPSAGRPLRAPQTKQQSARQKEIRSINLMTGGEDAKTLLRTKADLSSLAMSALWDGTDMLRQRRHFRF
jgi:hypothetical protein